jgi:glutaredoxin-like protein NrdH
MNSGSRKKPSMYGLSTCGWCAKARAWLESNAESYELVYVDLLDEPERARVLDELRSRVPKLAFPIVLFGEECVVGYDTGEYERLLERAG